MNLYLDTSALVKVYLEDEPGAEIVAGATREATLVGTAMVSRAEAEAALAKAIRTDTLTREEATAARDDFRSDWSDLVRIETTESLVTRASRLAWEFDLRGYDALQLASALVWREGLGETVRFAAFDLQLWKAARHHPVSPFPDDLPSLLTAWQRP